jgi:hypothetical protein
MFAEAVGATYAQTSAKESVGVEETFRRVVEDAVQANLVSMAFGKEEVKEADLLKEGPPKPMKKGCC